MNLEAKPSEVEGAVPTATRLSPIRTLLVTAVVFGGAFAGAGIAFMALAVFGPAHRADPVGHLWANFLMGSYLMTISSAFSTFAFVVPVACSVQWRRLLPRSAAGRSAFFGVVAFFISITGLQYHLLRAIPAMKLIPVFGLWLQYLLPGALMGLLAVVAIWLASFCTSKSPQTAPDPVHRP